MVELNNYSVANAQSISYNENNKSPQNRRDFYVKKKTGAP
jgi:hypothetical protein